MDTSPAGNPIGTEDTFYTTVYRRLIWAMAVLAVAGTVSTWIVYRAPLALCFLVGSVVAMLNFHWLKRTVEAMGNRLPNKTRSAWSVVLRFLLRYVLIAAAAYVIFKSTTNSLYGFFAGLAVPVGAILMEALYETYRFLRTEF